MTRNRFAASIVALSLATALLLSAGCKSSGPAATTVPPDFPKVTAAPDKATPPPVGGYEGYYLRIKPAKGPDMILKEPIGAQLVMESYASLRLEVKDAVARYKNKLDVLGPDGKVQYSFTLASDGQFLLKYKNGKVFRMPEYIYYLIEQNLWTYGGTLMDNQLKWQPEPTASSQPQLELDLPRLINTAMMPAFGYAMAYFSSYRIYGVNTATKNVAKVYMLITYAGYDIKGTAFAPVFLYTTPATLIFNQTGAGGWTLAELKQPPETKASKDLYANIRTIFPYECMEAVMADLKDGAGAAEQTKDIVQQATEYLNEVAINGLTVES